MQAQRESTQAVTNARLTRAAAKLRTRRTLKRAKTPKSATRTHFPPRAGKPVLHKVPLPMPLPHNSAPPPRATKSRIANGAEHRPRWVLRHRGAAGAGAFRDRRSRSKHGGSPVRHPVLGDARGYASATCAEHSPTPHSKTVSAAWERLPYNRTPSGEGQPNSSAACNRLPSSGARCLPANYGERADFTQKRRIRFSLPVGCSHSCIAASEPANDVL